MHSGRPTLAQIRELAKSRLCRRITLLICLSILAVEAAFLLPSYLKRQDELRHHQEMEVLLATKAALSWYEMHSAEEMLQQNWPSFQHVTVTGTAVYALDGRLLASRGALPELNPAKAAPAAAIHRENYGSQSHGHDDSGAIRQESASGTYYEVLWPPDVSGLPFNVVARIDTTAMTEELHAYVLRIGGLILVLSLVVSVVTVAVVGRSVLTPILAIHKNLTAAHSDPLNAESYKLDIQARNEIGETVNALNALLGRLSSLRRSHIREREERFQDFAASSSDWFWEMDENLRFCFFSERFAEVTGVPETMLLGKTRQETGVPGVDAATWQQHLADLQAHRPFRNFVHSRQKPGGETVWLSINGNPWFDRDGTFRGYRGTGRDITEQMATQRALQTAKEEAEAANRTKSEFLANISHELRTPLNAIIGFSEVMLASEAEAQDNSRHRGYLEDIHSSGLHLLSLINDILDLSKIEAGADELNEESLDVAEVARKVLRVVRQRADKAGVAFEWSADTELPALLADERKLKQALLNLVVNAIKFTPAGGRVSLAISCSDTEGYAFEVIDNGIGMAPEDIATALRQFGQVDSALNRRYEGTGLGLPLTKALVELHGGTLELDSRLGEGTKVRIRLPASRIIASAERSREHKAG